jgi:tRNA(Ile)-lysidine synthase
MISPLAAAVGNTIRKHEMVHVGDRVAVAVSGGGDSVALLRLFGELREGLGITLCVAHFNHQLRAADSDADEHFVAALARRQGLEFIGSGADVAAAAKQRSWNVEDASRRVRYDFFAKIVANGGATHVATAHTADDQAETVLTRLIRGTGLTGLGSIHPVRGPIIRPLLETRRADLRTYLAAINQEWREDATNADPRRLRARIRHRLLPEIEQYFSVSIVNKLGELAGLARDEEDYWVAAVEERYQHMVTRNGDNSSIGARELLWPMGGALPEEFGGRNPFRAFTQRIIRRLYQDAGPTAGELSRKHVEQVIELAGKPSGRCVELPGGVRVHKQFERLIFECGRSFRVPEGRTATDVSYAYSVELSAGGTACVSVAELGKRFRLKVIDWPLGERETRSGGVVLDAERLRPPLVLRNWKPGDAYCPKGRRHSRKLTRMLIASRVGSAQRASWPVLTSAGRVAWADRMPAAEEFSASEATRTGVWIFEDGG